MAKKSTDAAADSNGITLTAGERKTIMTLKADVVNMGNKLANVREMARDVAPRIMKHYNTLAAKYEGLDFVGYAREFDSTVPTHAQPKDGKPGYLVHKVYMALDYMRRIQRTTKQRTRMGGAGQGRVDPATDQVARLVKSLTNLVADPEPIWAALVSEFKLETRMVSRLKTRVEAAKPLLNLKGYTVKSGKFGAVEVEHAEPAKVADDKADDKSKAA